MKIGLVISKFNPQRGGAEQWTYDFAARLLARGHEVHVISMAFSEQARALPLVAHCLEPGLGRIRFAEAAEAKLRTLCLDVIHDMGMGWYCDVLTLHGGAWQASTEGKSRSLPRWLLPLKQASLFILPRYRIFRRLSSRQFAEPSRIIVALSRMVAEDLVRYYPVRPEQIRLVYNGVDTERFSPVHRSRYRDAMRAEWGISEDEVVYVFVGNDFHRKGLLPAVRAVGRLRGEGHPVRLLVVGGKPYRRIAYMLRRDRTAGAVQFTGQVADPVPFYAAADAFVLPTLYDPCSLSVLEAAACGLPCITTRFNGAGELLTDGHQGYILSDPCDDRQLAERMRRLLDGALRSRMGEAARRLMLQHTLDHNCDQIAAIYEEVLDAKRRGEHPGGGADAHRTGDRAFRPASRGRRTVDV